MILYVVQYWSPEPCCDEFGNPISVSWVPELTACFRKAREDIRPKDGRISFVFRSPREVISMSGGQIAPLVLYEVLLN
jgi:hypothetical protein